MKNEVDAVTIMRKMRNRMSSEFENHPEKFWKRLKQSKEGFYSITASIEAAIRNPAKKAG